MNKDLNIRLNMVSYQMDMSPDPYTPDIMTQKRFDRPYSELNAEEADQFMSFIRQKHTVTTEYINTVMVPRLEEMNSYASEIESIADERDRIQRNKRKPYIIFVWIQYLCFATRDYAGKMYRVTIMACQIIMNHRQLFNGHLNRRYGVYN